MSSPPFAIRLGGCQSTQGSEYIGLEIKSMPSNGKVALVTGAGSGIGRAVSLAFQSVGYSVVLAGRRLLELEKAAALATPGDGKMLAVPTDVSRPDSIQAAFTKTKEVFGRLDILFKQCRYKRAQCPDGRPHVRTLDSSCGYQSHEHFSVHKQRSD
jgi:short chain dehydrogenase